MRRVWLLLLGTVLSGTVKVPARATGTAPTSQRIMYVRKLPTAVRRRLPKTAQSCFFGSFKLTANGPDFWLHLYHKNPHLELNPSSRGSTFHFDVDLFQVTRVTKKRVQHVQLLSSFPLTYKASYGTPTQFGADLLWLDPGQKREPIIKFDCFFQGYSGPMGDDVLAVFTKGLKVAPLIQSFGYGFWHASDTAGEQNSFDTVDTNGLLQVTQQTLLTTNEVPPPPPWVWRWSGKTFTPVPDKTPL